MTKILKGFFEIEELLGTKISSKILKF